MFRAEVTYPVYVTKTIDVPEEWEFLFTKESEDWTDEELSRFEYGDLLNVKTPFEFKELVQIENAWQK